MLIAQVAQCTAQEQVQTFAAGVDHTRVVQDRQQLRRQQDGLFGRFDGRRQDVLQAGVVGRDFLRSLGRGAGNGQDRALDRVGNRREGQGAASFERIGQRRAVDEVLAAQRFRHAAE